MAKILITEDDEGIISFIKAELEHEGFSTIEARTGRDALELYESENPDLVLLDLMLPELNGFEVLRRIRKSSNVPVIIETARDESFDKINGLNSGADDYIAKPFDIEELIARINAVLRRTNSQNKSHSIIINELELNIDSLSVKVNGKNINMSKTEFMILKLLMENSDKVLSRNDIIDNVWGKDHYIDINTVDVYVGYLMNKIKSNKEYEYIKTVRGAGYMFKEQD